MSRAAIKFTNSSCEHQTNVELHFPDEPDVQNSTLASDLTAMRLNKLRNIRQKYLGQTLQFSRQALSFSLTDSMLAKSMFWYSTKFAPPSTRAIFGKK